VEAAIEVEVVVGSEAHHEVAEVEAEVSRLQDALAGGVPEGCLVLRASCD